MNGDNVNRGLLVIYKSIADRLRLRLNSSDFEVGSPLPGEKKLAEEFGVARMTIRKAIGQLGTGGASARIRHLCRPQRPAS